MTNYNQPKNKARGMTIPHDASQSERRAYEEIHQAIEALARQIPETTTVGHQLDRVKIVVETNKSRDGKLRVFSEELLFEEGKLAQVLPSPTKEFEVGSAASGGGGSTTTIDNSGIYTIYIGIPPSYGS